MLPRRYTRTDGHSAFTDSERHLILAAETLRAGDTADKRPKDGEKTEERISVFWRVFGGTILSITALMVISAYQTLANGIHEVRTDLGRLREATADFIKKDEFNSRTTKLWDGIREVQAIDPKVTVLTNRLTAQETQLTAADRERKEMQTAILQLTALKDRLAAADDARKLTEHDHRELQAAAATLAALKEKDAALEKQVKDAEAERREVQRELLQLRERLAKLEGQREAKPAGASGPPADQINKIDGDK
ncbi:MAG TPA: hypothetical protein VGF55_30885 [Gemmataceae bacterium]